MQHIQDLNDLRSPFRRAVVTIGNFDGVHIGHQALFYEVIEKANTIDGTSVAITFEPHPLRVLKRSASPPLITIFEQKVELIERSGMDVLVSIPFTLEFAAISAQRFVEELLVRRIGTKAIVVGEDYAFGKNREGDIALLNSMGPELGFEVIVTGMIRTVQGIPDRISSTAIRELVQAGEMQQAGRMLGRHFQIRGTVVAGRDRGGKLLGFPTANLKLEDALCPRTGIYAVTVEIQGRLLQGVANIGYSPTFADMQFTVEVHILDFDETIYGHKLRVNFIKRIRDEIKFSSLAALKAQIAADTHAARRLLAENGIICRA
jgi:riboflavin kinase/FMN adenylyltransferase